MDLMSILLAILPGLLAAVGKNALGWAKNSLEDGKLQPYELKLLAETTLVTMIVYFAGYFGIGLITDNPEIPSMVAAFIISTLYDGWKKA